VAELATRFGVAKMTISNAIAALRDEGLVQTRQGSPSVVLATPDEANEEVPESSEEFQIISAQLQDMRSAIKKLSSRLDDLDERTRGIGET
jgi:DNA-binding GntR family transcriptional regulator